MRQRQTILIYLLLLLFGINAAYVYKRIQQSNNYQVNLLADANEYEKIYDHFNGNNANYQVRFGIHNRILIPFLASNLPEKDISANFFMLNTFFALLSLMALFYLMQLVGIDKMQVVLALVFFSLHWVGPFRQNAISPINVDMAVYFFEIVLLILFIKKRYFLLLILIPFAIAAKELFLALIIVFLFIGLVWRYKYQDKSISIPWIFGIAVVGIITKLMLNYYYPSSSPGRNSMLVMAFHSREMILHPDHAFRWILSLFAAFGAFLFLIINKPKDVAKINQDDLMIHILTLSVLALSFLGGMDYTRLIFLGFPYVIISILKLSKPNNAELLLVFFLSLILTRFWKVLPEAAADISVYNAWMPENASTRYLVLWALTVFFYLILFFGGKAILRLIFKSDHTSE